MPFRHCRGKRYIADAVEEGVGGEECGNAIERHLQAEGISAVLRANLEGESAGKRKLRSKQSKSQQHDAGQCKEIFFSQHGAPPGGLKEGCNRSAFRCQPRTIRSGEFAFPLLS